MVASKKYCPEQPDGDGNNNHGHSLLSFMKLASNKVKTALEKPNNFKRNINHRRFLQKQFKTLVKGPGKVPTRKQFPVAKDDMQPTDYIPCDYNNQIPSPPVDVSSLQFEPLQPYIQTMNIQQTFVNPFGAPTSSNICERRHFEGSRVPDTVYYNSPLPELDVEEEDVFLTGEELTQAIELKDLFIPETDLTQYLFNNNETNLDFDSWICRDVPRDRLTVF